MENGMLAMILQEETKPPYSYKEYHEFLTTRGCEENLEFLGDCILYQRLTMPFFPDRIDVERTTEMLAKPGKIPFPKKPETWQVTKYEDGLEMAKRQYIELCEKYILPGSPRQITIPSAVVKALEEAMDMGYFHPDLLTEPYFVIFEKLLTEDFHIFVETQAKVEASQDDSGASASASTSPSEIQAMQERDELSDKQSILNDDQYANSLYDTDSIKSGKISRNTSIAAGSVAKSSRVAVPRGHPLIVLTSASGGSPSSANSEVTSPPHSISKSPSLGDITIDRVLANLTAPPYSRKQYRIFLEITKSEENLDFLIEVMDYQKLAAKFFAQTVMPARTLDLFENSEQLSKFEIQPTSEEQTPMTGINTIEGIAAAVQDIANKYIRNQAPNEINLSSRIKKPLLMLIETGHYNPEIFSEAVSYIRDMLQQNGFDNFLKTSSNNTTPTGPEIVKKVLVSGRSAAAGGGGSPRVSESTMDSAKILRKPSDGTPSVSSSKKFIPSARFGLKTKRDDSTTSMTSSHSSSGNNDTPNSPLSPKAASIHESVSSRKKIVPSGRAAKGRVKNPSRPSNLSQSHQSPRGSVTGPPGEEASLRSYLSEESRESKSRIESTEELDRNSVSSQLEKAFSSESIHLDPAVAAVYTAPAPSAVPEAAPVPDTAQIVNTSQPGTPEPVRTPVMRSGRAAVKASGRSAVPSSGRSATPANSRAAVPKSSVPDSVAPVDDAGSSSDATGKEKKGLFGFGRKK